MSKIRKMSSNLSNKIAAGEVIEKCSSIVKELVENSIDAKSKNIKVELVKGGLEKIVVLDDGSGMDKDDAILCFERHATSKIYKDDDLFFINTLGFRGEALASIASVSRCILTTSNGVDSGTLVDIKGGEVLNISDFSLRKGTKFEITDLFYNTPARLKYLKSENSELASIVSLIEKFALSNPDISFVLTNNNKEIVKTSGSNDLLKCIHEIFGSSISSNALRLNVYDDDFEINGYICKPSILKSTKNNMFVFVNDRIIKNYDINQSINDAYYTYKPQDRYPVVVLNIYVDPTLQDVNIHPTKQDIKISKMNELKELLYKSIKDVLYNDNLIIDVLKDDNTKSISTTNNNTFKEYNYVQNTLDFTKENIEKNEKFKKLDLHYIGICFDTYIICQNEDGIHLIDQHAAQERINYEKYLEELKNEKVIKKDMLIPLTLEYSKSDFIKLKNKLDILLSLGFVVEEFGINTFIVKSHPNYLKKGYEDKQIEKIFELLIENDNFDIVKFRENTAITLACKMAIKANDHISYELAIKLIDNLSRCDNPYNCPHGRPTIINFSLYELEKMFKRTN